MDSNCETVHRVLSSYQDSFFQLKDIVEDAIEGKLEATQFPYLSNQRDVSSRSKVQARYNDIHLIIHCSVLSVSVLTAMVMLVVFV